MLTAYIRAAMHKATYKILDDDGTFFGSIPECPGVWANEKTLEACRDDLQGALESWIVTGLRWRDTLPVLDGIDLNVSLEVVEENEAEEVEA
jgi:predicted RNase H-like HicB family nuclease